MMHAPAALLDSYEVERRPIAEENSRQSLDNALKMVEIFEALGMTADPAESRRNMTAALDEFMDGLFMTQQEIDDMAAFLAIARVRGR